MAKKRKCKKPKQEIDYDDLEMYDSDETFAYIAGYTSGGAPYGITHEELAADETLAVQFSFDEIDDDDDLPF